MGRKRYAGLTLIELLVVIVIIILLAAVLMPSGGGHARMSRRSHSLANMSGLYKSCMVAANDDGGLLPGTYPGAANYGVPRQKDAVITISGQVGVRRDQQYTDAETKVSPTRPLWNLIRSGLASPNQLVNPNTSNYYDDTINVSQYYDFSGANNVSYGYQCPYGNPKAAPNLSQLDVQTVLIADRGPYFQDDHGGFNATRDGTSLPTGQTKDTVMANTPLGKTRTDCITKKWNSPNGGYEGVGYVTMGGGAKFDDSPFVGKGLDNIYTYGSDSLETVAQPNYDGRGFLNGLAGPTVDPVSTTHPQPLTNYDSYIVP